MNAVKDNSSIAEQPKQLSPEELNAQLNIEFAIIRVRTAGLELLKLKYDLLTFAEQTEEVVHAKSELIEKIAKFPV